MPRPSTRPLHRLAAFWRLRSAVVCAAVLVLCVGLLLLQAWHWHGQAQRQAGQLAVAANQQWAAALAQHLALQRAELQAMAGWPELAEALGHGKAWAPGDLPPAQRLARRLRARLEQGDGSTDSSAAPALTMIDRLTWFDEAGRPGVDVGDIRAAAMPPMANDLQATQRLDLIHQRLMTRAPVVFNGRYGGQLVAMADASTLLRALAPATAGTPGALLTLMGANGHEVARTDGLPALSPALAARLAGSPADVLLTLPPPVGTHGPDGRWVKSAVPGLDAQLVAWWPLSTLLAPSGPDPGLPPLAGPGMLATAGLALLALAGQARSQRRLRGRARLRAGDLVAARADLAELRAAHQALSLDRSANRQALDQLRQQHQALALQREQRDLAWERLFSVLPDQAFRLGRDGTVLDQWAGLARPGAPTWQVTTGQRLQQALPADAALLAREALSRLNAGGGPMQTRHRLASAERQVDAVAHWLPLGPEQRLLVLRPASAAAPHGSAAPDRPGPDLSHLSHDIRTPLNAVIGLARVGDRDSAGRAARAQFRLIAEAGQRLLAVLNPLLGLGAPAEAPAAAPARQARSEALDATLPEAPLTPSPAAPPADSPADAIGPRLSGLRVLAAEDNDVNRLVLQSLLEHEGASVEFAEDGQEAVDRVGTDPSQLPDLVLMDVQMPVMDGLQATRLIRQRHPHLPVIGLTAHAMAEERARCLAAGMNEHVTKPVDIEVLVRRVLQQVRPRPLPTPALALAAIDWPRLVQGLGGRADLAARICRTAANSLAPVPERLRAAAARGDAGHLASLAQELAANLVPLRADSTHALALRTVQAAGAGPDAHAGLLALAEDLACATEALAADARRHPLAVAA